MYLFQLKNNGRLDVKLMPACWLAYMQYIREEANDKMAIYFEE